MSSTHDFHFPEICFREVINEDYVMLMVPEKEPLFQELTFSNLVAVHTWELDTLLALTKNPRQFKKDGDYIGFLDRYFYDIFYIKECMLNNIPQVEWESGVLISHPDDFKLLYNIEDNCLVKVVCLKKVIPNLKRFNNEYRTSKL